MKIGIVGFGSVGKAFIKLLINKREYLSNLGIKIEVNFVINSKSGVYDESGIDLESLLRFAESTNDLSKYSNGGLKNVDFFNLIKLSNIDYLIEMTPTNMYTGEPGLTYIRQALKNKINVVTANKGPILLAYSKLKAIASENGVALGIGCTCGGALPSVSLGLIDMAGAEITSIEGILNGTTNFILDYMYNEGVSYKNALKIAQDMGIAETNPQLDVEGWDSAIKLVILTNVIMNQSKTLEDVEIQGITSITEEQIEKAKANGEKYRLIAKTLNNNGHLIMTVKPERINNTHFFYNVTGKNKAVLYRSNTLGDIASIGGASDVYAAAASLLRDIINIQRSSK